MARRSVSKPDRRGNKPTQEQQNFIDIINQSGGLAFVAHSVDEVEERHNGYFRTRTTDKGHLGKAAVWSGDLRMYQRS